MKILLLAAAAAFYFRDQIASAIAPSTTVTIDPATGATVAPGSASSPPATHTLPTIASDRADVHNQLVASAMATSPDRLARVQKAYGLRDSDFLLTVSQWNWYLSQTGGEGAAIITQDTDAGNNAIPASRYLQLRQQFGLVPA